MCFLFSTESFTFLQCVFSYVSILSLMLPAEATKTLIQLLPWMEYLLTRLDEKILSLNKASKKALVAYLVAGDPDLDSTLELMHGFVNAGVDILEIGVPFTDPIAEGPIIQAAHDRALKNKHKE